MNVSRKQMLFCALDIGSRMEHYTAYLRKKYPQHSFKSFSKYQLNKEHYQSKYDFQFNYHRRSKLTQYLISTFFFLYTLYRFDIIFMISGENILTRKLLKFELATYKFFGKKLIMNFVGADIRNPDYTSSQSLKLVDEKISNNNISKQKPFQRKLCKLAEEFADDILVVSPDLIRFFNKEVKHVPVFIDEPAFKKEVAEQAINKVESIPTILHAPSNPLLKGTPYIKEMFDKLSKQYNWRFILTTEPEYFSQKNPPYSVSKYELFKYYSFSDLVIDQLVVGWYGMQSIEALIAGSRVVCLIDRELMKYLPQSSSLDIIHDVKELESKVLEIMEGASHEAESDNAWITELHNIERNPVIQEVFKTYLG